MNKEEKLKELLNKVKETPDNIIEEAIDSLSEKLNKEEIEEIKKLLFQDRLTQYGKRKLVQYLEQKESILDKVTDYIKKDIEENMLSEKCNEDGMGTYWRGCIDTEAEILNIIEGGTNNGK